jgi:hypothetical protein
VICALTERTIVFDLSDTGPAVAHCKGVLGIASLLLGTVLHGPAAMPPTADHGAITNPFEAAATPAPATTAPSHTTATLGLHDPFSNPPAVALPHAPARHRTPPGANLRDPFAAQTPGEAAAARIQPTPQTGRPLQRPFAPSPPARTAAARPAPTPAPTADLLDPFR